MVNEDDTLLWDRNISEDSNHGAILLVPTCCRKVYEPHRFQNYFLHFHEALN